MSRFTTIVQERSKGRSVSSCQSLVGLRPGRSGPRESKTRELQSVSRVAFTRCGSYSPEEPSSLTCPKTDAIILDFKISTVLAAVPKGGPVSLTISASPITSTRITERWRAAFLDNKRPKLSSIHFDLPKSYRDCRLRCSQAFLLR